MRRGMAVAVLAAVLIAMVGGSGADAHIKKKRHISGAVGAPPTTFTAAPNLVTGFSGFWNSDNVRCEVGRRVTVTKTIGANPEEFYGSTTTVAVDNLNTKFDVSGSGTHPGVYKFYFAQFTWKDKRRHTKYICNAHVYVLSLQF